MTPGRSTVRGIALVVGAALCLATGIVQADDSRRADLDFDRTFARHHAPATAHFVARYQAGGSTHTLEVWRDGERRLVRRTDDAITTHVTRSPGDAEWHMTVLDLKRRIRTDIDRTSLYRIGHFGNDWFGMAHGLARPRGPYTLRVADAPATASVSALQACRWYTLSQGGRESRICWSTRLQLPIAMTDAQGVQQWQVTHVDTRRIAAATFRVNDAGFARNDANEDIRAD